MDLKPQVRGELLLSKDLLSRSEYHASGNEWIAHDIIIADDAAEIALGAICSQLGCTACKRRPCITDYFDWMLQIARVTESVPGMEYLTELHKARIDLQTHCIIPDLFKWQKVKEVTLGFITRWCQELLHVQVWNLQWDLAGDACWHRANGTKTVQDEAHQMADGENRRESPRYDCDGNAEIHVVTTGRIVRGRIVNLSLGGCYIESAAGLEIGSRVEIVLRLSGLAFRAVGEIRSCYGSSGIGVKFISLSVGGSVVCSRHAR